MHKALGKPLPKDVNKMIGVYLWEKVDCQMCISCQEISLSYYWDKPICGYCKGGQIEQDEKHITDAIEQYKTSLCYIKPRGYLGVIFCGNPSKALHEMAAKHGCFITWNGYLFIKKSLAYLLR